MNVTYFMLSYTKIKYVLESESEMTKLTIQSTLELLEDIDPSKMSAFFKLMSEEIRFKLTFVLAHYGEACVSDLAEYVDSTVTTTSHHLQILKKNKVINSRREGKQIFYFIDNPRVTHFINVGLDFGQLS